MNVHELLESSKIENKDNIIRFLSAKSYNEYKVIDENNSEIIINENEKVIIPNELLYCFVNVCAPYDDVLSECVELFLNENNIILDESTSLANPNIFGALLISTENIDLFKDWYEYKNYLLNENCMYINTDDRVNILAQYLYINELFDKDKFLQLEVPDQFLNETIIGSVNGLYSLLIEANDPNVSFHNQEFRSKDDAIKMLYNWGAKNLPGKGKIEVIEDKKHPGSYWVTKRKIVQDKMNKIPVTFSDSSQLVTIKQQQKKNGQPFVVKKIDNDSSFKSNKAKLSTRFDTRVGNFIVHPATRAVTGTIGLVGKGIKNVTMGTVKGTKKIRNTMDRINHNQTLINGVNNLYDKAAKTKQFFKKVKNSDRYKKIKDSVHKGIIGATTSTLNKINSIPQTVRNRFTPELGWKKGLFSVKPVHNIK